MRGRTLQIVLALCTALALAPFVPWAIAALFESIADQTLSALAVTIPLSLGLAAVALAVHGLLLQRELVESLEANYAEVLDGTVGAPAAAPVAVGALATVGAGNPVVATSATAVETQAGGSPGAAAAGAGEAGGGKGNELGGKAKKKIRTVGKSAGGRLANRGKSRATGAAKREGRQALRGIFKF